MVVWLCHSNQCKSNHTNVSVQKSQDRKKYIKFGQKCTFLATAFFDCNGVVHHDYLPQGRTVNKEYYLEAICQKRTELWKNQSWILHHDNVPTHTSMIVHELLVKNETLIMPQQPYFIFTIEIQNVYRGILLQLFLFSAKYRFYKL